MAEKVTNCLTPRRFDELVDAKPVPTLVGKNLTGWRALMHFTGYSKEFLQKIRRTHPDCPIGFLGGRPFANRKALYEWMLERSNAA